MLGEYTNKKMAATSPCQLQNNTMIETRCYPSSVLCICLWIIVTLSVVCTLKGMSRLSIQRIKAMLLCIVYAMLFVNTVDMKIKAHNALNAIYVDTVDTKHIHTFLSITFLIFNRFSIRKKFWKAETEGFSTILLIWYMSILSIQDKDL